MNRLSFDRRSMAMTSSPCWPRILLNAYATHRHPLSLVHFVTERCNARCRHCFLDFSVPARDELNIDEIEQLARNLGPALVNVNLTGGEPLLRPDLWEICLAYYLNAGVASIYLTSNGSNVGRLRRLLDRYAASGISRSLTLAISIDDFPSAHDENRRLEDGFTRAMESYHLCAQYDLHGVKPNIALTITGENHRRVVSLYRYLRDSYAVQSVTVTALRETGASPRISTITRQEIGLAYQALTREIQADRHAGRVTGLSDSLTGRLLDAKNANLQNILAASYAANGQGHPPCSAARLFAVVRANGDVYPCEMLAERSLGNLRAQGYKLEEMLHGKEAQAVRNEIAQRNCHCTYECALGVSLISRWRHMPPLAAAALHGVIHAR
jgi:radical SAM protein with 4Fe4S-binding SPASM domain